MKNKDPLVSVIIPCYNHERFIIDSIQSIVDQTYSNIELIIIDDGSTDSSVEKIKEMCKLCQNRFVKFEFRSRSNKGLSSTLNEAVKWCSGKYYSIIASDDEMLSEKTAIQVNFLEKHKKVNAVFGGALLIDEEGRIVGDAIPSKRKLSFKNIVISNYTIIAPTQMMRMEAISALKGEPYNPDIKIEDWYMWLRLSKNSNLYNMQQPLVKYRQHDNNTMKNKELINEARIKVLDEFSESKHYKRALSQVILLNHINIHNNLSIRFIYENKNLFKDLLTYKKIIQLTLNRLKK